MKDASQILNEILSERKTANPNYSLRAFARDLGLSAPQLSNVMNGHRGLSPEMAETISTLLSLDTRQKEVFSTSLKAKFSPRKAERIVAKAQLEDLNHHSESKYLDLDLFKVVSNWHHFALIELIKISKAKKDQTLWFSEKLGIPENEVRLALGRLERLSLIEKAHKGFLSPVPTYTYKGGNISTALFERFTGFKPQGIAHVELVQKNQRDHYLNFIDDFGSRLTTELKYTNQLLTYSDQIPIFSRKGFQSDTWISGVYFYSGLKDSLGKPIDIVIAYNTEKYLPSPNGGVMDVASPISVLFSERGTPTYLIKNAHM